MLIEKVSLFTSKRDFFIFLIFCGFIFTYALLIEYNNYKNLTQFDSNIVKATILKQYTKTKRTKKGKIKSYQVLKLKANKNFSFYTTSSKKFPPSQGKEISLEIWAGKISFYEYMTSFFSFSRIIHDENTPSVKVELNTYLDSIHPNQNIASIYKALYTATALPRNLQETFSTLGVSHLLAISGFHLGVLSTFLFLLFRMPYTFFQNNYFPYRSYKIDSFLFISFILFGYLLFLDIPASLLRAFVMLIIGFILYDRGYKILTMMTLFLTAILIISFTPRLLFSLGFWLSIFGVFYIFLFLIHFKKIHKIWQFIFVPFWVYVMMLPLSLYIFENFSIYHPFSIILTSVFSLFYPLSIFLHFIGFGTLLDEALLWLLNIEIKAVSIGISSQLMALFLSVSLLAIYKKLFVYILLGFALSIFVYAIYNVT